MLHAAAMFLGLCVVWLLATQRFATVDDLGVAVVVALMCTAIGMRAAGASAAFARAPRAIYTVIARLGSVLAGAGATVRAALAADVTLKPALVRVRTRGHTRRRLRDRPGDEVEDGVEQEKRDEERGHPSSLTADASRRRCRHSLRRAPPLPHPPPRALP